MPPTAPRFAAPALLYGVPSDHGPARSPSLVAEAVRAADAAAGRIEANFARLLGLMSEPDEWPLAGDDAPDPRETADTLRFPPADGDTLSGDG